MIIYDDGINDIKEIMEELKRIRTLDDSSLKDELTYYKDSIKGIKIRNNKQHRILLLLNIAYDLGIIPEEYKESMDNCMEELLYENTYLKLYKYLITKKLHKKNYEETDNIYLALAGINTIGNNRERIIGSLTDIINKENNEPIKEKKDVIYKDNDNNILIKKLFKNIK